MTINQLKNFLFIATQYLSYFLERTDHHSLQTPFAYAIYRNLMAYYRQHKGGDQILEMRRVSHCRDYSILTLKDEGAGSNYFKGSERPVASICKTACSSLPYNLLYQFFVSETPRQIVVELGTSLGINTGYLAAKTTGTVYTFEADPTLLNIAKQNLKNFNNIRFVLGNIQFSFPEFLKEQTQIDFIQVDAHHNYDATILYCKFVWPFLHENSIVVIGDIHWSAEMQKAWNEIKCFPKVKATMDFFECGVVFFKHGIQNEHHVLYYPSR